MGDIRDRADEGHPPDIALFPQTGLLAELATAGFVVPLRTNVRKADTESILPSVVEAVTTDRGLDGVPFRVNVKSLVWYRPDVFDEYGDVDVFVLPSARGDPPILIGGEVACHDEPGRDMGTRQLPRINRRGRSVGGHRRIHRTSGRLSLHEIRVGS
ncbi:MAG: extracellular solute-binding protein [Armatimonadetes bacterium]|nr:MAG: extracellular solute-binding protein [Armatimonadota bacterium]